VSAAAAFSSAQALLLAQLASLAAQDLDAVQLPSGWVMLGTFTVPGGIAPGAQGFYAKGPMPGVSGRAAVLALGVPWGGFVNAYVSGAPVLGPLPSAVTSAAARVDVVQTTTYNALRASVWSGLAQVGALPLFVTGMGLAGVQAQLAAADLRPGQTGPSGEEPPSAVPTCYVFSSPPSGDPGFAQFIANTVPAAFNVSLGSAALPVDLFPTAPGAAGGYNPAGTAQPLAAPLSSMDDPWVERSPAWYQRALGGTPQPPPQQPGSVPEPPAGFSQALAHSLAALCGVAYQRSQHPGSLLPSTSPFSVVGDVTANGVVFCTLFSSPDMVVAAFRGTVTWQEFAGLQCNSLGVPLDYLNSEFAMVHGGVAAVAQAPVTPGGATPFRQQLVSQLQALSAGKQLLLAGHDFGGALANLTAMDLSVNAAAQAPAAVYTFGAMPVGNVNFAQMFNQAFPSTSYQVMRPGDFAGSVNVMHQYQAVGTPVQLTGTPPDDDPTQHALTGYAALLNPYATAAQG
jgi:hypothetical protein